MKRMKKISALIAAALIAAATTACGDGESVQANATAAQTESASHDFTFDGFSGTYTGGWTGGMPNGEGSFVSSDGAATAAGVWSNGQLNGKCRWTEELDDLKLTYNGDFFYGAMQGNGEIKIEYKSGDLVSFTYSGEWKDNKKDGMGESNSYYSDEKAAELGYMRINDKGYFSGGNANGEFEETIYLTEEAAESLGAEYCVYSGEAKDGALIEPYRYTFYKGATIVEQGRVRDGKHISDGEKKIKDGAYDLFKGVTGKLFGETGEKVFDAIVPYDRNAE